MLVVLSCTDDLGVSSDSIELVKVKNGYLDFKDEASFELISTQLKGKTQGELEQWENNLQGFTSLRSIFREGMHQEEIYLANGGKSVGQSQFVINHKDAFIVVNGDDLQPNLPPQENDDMLLNFVNEFGLIKIGTSIFEYRSGSIKEIRDGDESKIKDLNQVSESSKTMNISVISISVEYITDKTGRNLKIAFSGNSSCTGFTSGGGQRVIGNIAIYDYTMVDVWGQTPYPGQVVYKTEVQTQATNQIKGTFGWRNKDTGQLQIIGTVNVSPYGSVSVSHNSGGALVSSISKTIYSSGWVNTQWNPVISISGALTFHGRDNSQCTI